MSSLPQKQHLSLKNYSKSKNISLSHIEIHPKKVIASEKQALSHPEIKQNGTSKSKTLI
jgi:hypothetical protein